MVILVLLLKRMIALIGHRHDGALEHTLAYSGKPRRSEIEAVSMRLRNALWMTVIAIVCMLAIGCHRTPDEVAVKQAVAAAERAAEQTDAGAFADHLTDDFTGNAGEADRAQLANLLRLARLRHESVHVLMGAVTVVPRGDRYVASFTVTLTSGGRLLPEDMGVYDVESAWHREGEEWKCYSATWKRPL
ncbi:hypothetical protein ACO2Q2_11250 [Dyella sp. KRB-257]